MVVACNSASAAALHYLREQFPDVRFVGMEPAVKPAASRSERGVIGVLATDATFQGELYASVVDRHANGTEVIEQACPDLADAVERLGVDHPDTLELVRRYVTPLRDAGIDTLVLGCTHYPFLIDAIVSTAGPEVLVIDPAPAVARQTKRMLGRVSVEGPTEFLTTGDTNIFVEQISGLLGIEAVAKKVNIEATDTPRISVVDGDITQQQVGAIVNAANIYLRHGGGVAAAIVAAGGAVIQEESNIWVEQNGPLSPGIAAVTTAGQMPAEKVIHVAGPVFSGGQDNEGLLRLAVSAALKEAAALGLRSLAFPAISAGVYGYPVDEATAIIASEVVTWLKRDPRSLDEVRLVAFDRATSQLFLSGLAVAQS